MNYQNFNNCFYINHKIKIYMKNTIYNKLFKRKALAEYKRIELLKNSSEQYHLGLYQTPNKNIVYGDKWHNSIKSVHIESDKLLKSKFKRVLVDIFTISEYEIEEEMKECNVTFREVLSSVVKKKESYEKER